ncbi:MAG: hypothetical protein C0599_08540 [Salinivirgaceae bacterium]|nr:MAG: hypothetical protein C0599_08540 [Salinivirgaceae bacterium]
MKTLVSFLAATMLMVGCEAQNSTEQPTVNDDTTQIQPKTDIRVNKEYDDEGNLIRYDSVYSSYYSNIDGNPQVADSIMSEFRKHFSTQFPMSMNPFFDNMFFTDSLMQYDFYKDDFFHNRFKDNWRHMDEYFKEMDSIKNAFFGKQFPHK